MKEIKKLVDFPDVGIISEKIREVFKNTEIKQLFAVGGEEILDADDMIKIKLIERKDGANKNFRRKERKQR